MRTDYLTRTGSTLLDANGTGSVTLRPDVGQWWTPTLSRVSTINQTGTSYSAVYHGAVSDITPTAFIDDTFQGQGDSSSMVCGTVVAFGEGITARWTGGIPGDTAILTLYGTSSDTPPALGASIPSQPGAHFSGHVTGESTKNQPTIPITPLIPGQTTFTPVIDVRAFASYTIEVSAQTLNGIATSYNSCELIIQFFSEFSGGGVPIYVDVAEFWAQGGPGFVWGGGVFSLQDAVHGPYMNISVGGHGNDNIVVRMSFTTSTRVLPGPYAREDVAAVSSHYGIDGILARVTNQPIANGQTIQVPCAYGYGRARQLIKSTVGLGVNIGAGATGAYPFGSLDSIGVVAGVNSDVERVNPKRSLLISVFNGSGAAGSYSVLISTLYDKS